MSEAIVLPSLGDAARELVASLMAVGVNPSEAQWSRMVTARDALSRLVDDDPARFKGIATPAVVPLIQDGEVVPQETIDKLLRNPVSSVQWVPRHRVVANEYNPNSVPINEMRLLKTSVMADGYTQPIVCVRDEKHDRWIVVDGFHREITGGDLDVIAKWTDGYVPIVELTETTVADRMASTVRHNRARGKHSVTGMSALVLQMLDEGLDDQKVMSELGLTVDELTRYKYVSGFAKLFESADYRRAWMTRRQIALRKQYQLDHPDEVVPEI